MISNEMIIQKLIELISISLKGRLKKVILYGSMARKDNDQESDFDCIAIVDDVDDAVIDAIDESSASMLVLYSAVFSIIPVTEENFDEQKFNPLYINVNREGVVLWQKTA